MFITYALVVDGLGIPKPPYEPIILRHNDTLKSVVTISCKPDKPTISRFEAMGETTLDASLIPAFESLANHVLPAGSNYKNARISNITAKDGSFDPGITHDGSSLPDNVISFIQDVEGGLNKAIHETVEILRWRHNLPGPTHTLRVDTLIPNRWSLDGEQWYSTFHSITASLTVSCPRGHKLDLNETQDFLSAGYREPAGQELIREAWHHDLIKPRSALVIGFAALEVGFKDLVAKLVPNAEWLIGNMQSPAVVKMLKEYLPLLPIKAWINGKEVRIPSSTIRVLTKANELRNKIAHTSTAQTDNELIHEALLAIQDMLWLFDLCNGHLWAVKNIRQSTIMEIPDRP